MLYPSRIPYEESSVQSAVNVYSVDTKKFPKFAHARPLAVEVSPGEILFVPKHWCHHVQVAKAPAVSVNVWVHLRSDSLDRVREGVVRTLVGSLLVHRPNNSGGGGSGGGGDGGVSDGVVTVVVMMVSAVVVVTRPVLMLLVMLLVVTALLGLALANAHTPSA